MIVYLGNSMAPVTQVPEKTGMSSADEERTVFTENYYTNVPLADLLRSKHTH